MAETSRPLTPTSIESPPRLPTPRLRPRRRAASTAAGCSSSGLWCSAESEAIWLWFVGAHVFASASSPACVVVSIVMAEAENSSGTPCVRRRSCKLVFYVADSIVHKLRNFSGSASSGYIDESVDLGDCSRTRYTLLIYLSGKGSTNDSQALVGGAAVFYDHRGRIVAEVACM